MVSSPIIIKQPNMNELNLLRRVYFTLPFHAAHSAHIYSKNVSAIPILSEMINFNHYLQNQLSGVF